MDKFSLQDTDNHFDSGQHRPFQRADLIKKIPVSHLITFNNFYKTRLCSRLANGSCEWGETCNFAHSESELRGLNDLSSTRMCPQLLQQGSCSKHGCRFAHDEKELKATDSLYKTSICIEFKKLGRCRLGPRCRHAHGEGELRPKPAALFNIHDPRKFVREQQRKLRLRHQTLGRRSEMGKEDIRIQEFGAGCDFGGGAARPYDSVALPRESMFSAPTLLAAPASSLQKSKKESRRTTSSTAGETPCDELSSPDEPSESSQQQQFQLFQLKRQLQQLQQQLEHQQHQQQRHSLLIPSQPLLSGACSVAPCAFFNPLDVPQGVCEASASRAEVTSFVTQTQSQVQSTSEKRRESPPSEEEELLLALLSLLTPSCLAVNSHPPQFSLPQQDSAAHPSEVPQFQCKSHSSTTHPLRNFSSKSGEGFVECRTEPLKETDLRCASSSPDVLFQFLQSIQRQQPQHSHEATPVETAETAERGSSQGRSSCRFPLDRRERQQLKWKEQQRNWLTNCVMQAREAELSELLQTLQR